MSANSETKFLVTVLSTYGYNPHEQDCAQILADLCQTNHRTFLEICHDLIERITPTVLRPIHILPDNVLEAIAIDLYQILVPLWTLQMYNNLVNHIFNAQNMMSSAYNEENKELKVNYMNACFISLNNAYICINDILAGKI
jgi:hypothetical protein